jgi:hypothetical protein
MPNVENFNRIFTHAVKDLVWVIDYDLHPNLWTSVASAANGW